MRILLFADIHIGSIKDTTYFYNTITDIIEKEVVFNHTDAVIILGDYFDRLFKVNEEFVALSINIMSYLIRACIKNKTKIRIVYGTESHEMNQYKLFNYHFASHKIDMKLFTTATEEELFPNINVLYLPEEYIQDKHEFYKDTLYSGKHYQYIFGHGTIIEGMPENIKYSINSDNTEKQVPRFKSKELSTISDICVFGHYHCYTNMGDNTYYLGSLFRDSFGEETPKGYGIIEDNKFTFIENEKAWTYKTYEIDSKSTVYNDSGSILKEIEKIKKNHPDMISGDDRGKIRIIFHTPDNCDPSFKENLRNILFKDKIISPVIKEENTKLLEDIKEDIDEDMVFVIDPSLNVNDKIFQFINKTKPEEYWMTLKELNNYINKPLII